MLSINSESVSLDAIHNSESISLDAIHEFGVCYVFAHNYNGIGAAV